MLVCDDVWLVDTISLCVHKRLIILFHNRFAARNNTIQSKVTQKHVSAEKKPAQTISDTLIKVIGLSEYEHESEQAKLANKQHKQLKL